LVHRSADRRRSGVRNRRLPAIPARDAGRPCLVRDRGHDMRRALALLAVALISGCTARDRANPLDPRNPGTGGPAAGFTAIAGDKQVYLEWTSPDPRIGLSFELDRKIEGAGAFAPIPGTLLPNATSFLDLNVVNGTTYRYRLRFTALSSGAPASEDIAT